MSWATRGPYPVLCLAGEQGTGKSTLARLVRSLIDPASAPLRSEHDVFFVQLLVVQVVCHRLDAIGVVDDLWQLLELGQDLLR